MRVRLVGTAEVLECGLPRKRASTAADDVQKLKKAMAACFDDFPKAEE